MFVIVIMYSNTICDCDCDLHYVCDCDLDWRKIYDCCIFCYFVFGDVDGYFELDFDWFVCVSRMVALIKLGSLRLNLNQKNHCLRRKTIMWMKN